MDTDNINSTPKQIQERMSFCNSCEKNIPKVNIPTCLECDCTIGILVSLNFKSCPIGKW